MEVKGVSPLIPLAALDYVENYNLKPRAAFHAAIMDEFEQKYIVTDDCDFDKIKGFKRVKLT